MPRKRDTPSATKSEAAFDTLRQRIERGQLPGGAKLTLQELADELRMSLTPVREALRLLQAHGLVEYKRHQGHVVTRYSIHRAQEIYLLRETLEPLATRLAAERATAAELDEIAALHKEFADATAADDGEPGVIVDLNALWHRRIYETARSSLLDDFIDRLWTGVPYQAIWFIHRRDISVTDHDAVTQALLARDADTAASVMRDHIIRGKSATIEHLRAIGAPEE